MNDKFDLGLKKFDPTEDMFAHFGCGNCVALPNGPGRSIPGIWKCLDGTWVYDKKVVRENKEFFSEEDYERIMKITKNT